MDGSLNLHCEYVRKKCRVSLSSRVIMITISRLRVVISRLVPVSSDTTHLRLTSTCERSSFERVMWADLRGKDEHCLNCKGTYFAAGKCFFGTRRLPAG